MSSVPPKAWDEVQIGLLQRDVADLKRTAEKKPSKDIWDKFSALSGLVSGVVVALIGIYATTVLTRRQHSAEERRKDQEIRISRIQTVGTFMPQLAAGDERMKGVALVAIASLGDPDLAVRLAEALRGAGATSALTTIASGVDSSGAAGAKRALVDVLEFLKPRVVRVVTRGPGDDSRAGHGFVVSADGQIVTPAHVVDLPGATIEVMQGDQRRQAELKVIDKERDLALLSTKSAQSLVPLQISPAEPHAGERVSALFYVYDRPESPDNWRIQIGEVVGVMQPSGTRFSRVAVRIDTPPGSSGTPVVNTEGMLLGIVQLRDRQGVFLLISAAEIGDFLRKCGVSTRDLDDSSG